MTVSPLNNPAARLHAVLAEATAQAPSQGSALQAWAGIFGVATNAAGNAEVLRRGAELISMAAEVRRRVDALPHPVPGSFIAHLAGVDSCLDRFTTIGQLTMRDFMAPYGETAAQALVMCDWALQRDDPDPVPSDEDLADLLEGLAQWRQEIEQSREIDDERRTEVLVRLEEIRDVLSRVPSQGVGPATEAVNIFIGQLVIGSVGAPEQTVNMFGRLARFMVGAGLMLAGSASDSLVNQYLSSPQGHSAIEGVIRTVTGA